MWILWDSNRTENLRGSYRQLHYFRRIYHHQQGDIESNAIFVILQTIWFQLKEKIILFRESILDITELSAQVSFFGESPFHGIASSVWVSFLQLKLWREQLMIFKKSNNFVCSSQTRWRIWFFWSNCSETLNFSANSGLWVSELTVKFWFAMRGL